MPTGRRTRSSAEHRGDHEGQALSQYILAGAWEKQHDYHQAPVHLTSAIDVLQDHGNPRREALVLNLAGFCHARLGQHPQARERCEQALIRCRRHHYLDSESEALAILAMVDDADGRHIEAMGHAARAVAVQQDLGGSYWEAIYVEHLAEAHAGLGDHADARAAWERARDVYRTYHRTADALRLQRKLVEHIRTGSFSPWPE